MDVERRRILVTNFRETEQEPDLSEPPNCKGFGRIRHFRKETSAGWPPNPLPIDPAGAALGLPTANVLRAQVFQNAVCNWRCWYCFVPFDLLSANPKHSAWLTPGDLLDLYLDQSSPPPVIDLTGGQPDLAPEWVPWMMEESRFRGLGEKVYLWSDDNLSTDYFWKYLSSAQIDLVRSYRNYGRVCCFKGFDEESFSFNTLAEPGLFDMQFELMRRFVALGIDVYAYVTLTTSLAQGIPAKISRFVDRLQRIHELLPLRTVPLEITVFTPVRGRMTMQGQDALENQQLAIQAWNIELESRYSADLRAKTIDNVPLT